MKIQPIDNTPTELIENNLVKPLAKSRFKRLFERQFPSVLRISSVEKLGGGETQQSKDAGSDLEPSSVCLAKMVQNFIEEGSEKQSTARNRCNCFNGYCSDSSSDEFDFSCGFGDSITTASPSETCEILKSLVICASVAERNLLADTAKIVGKNKICKRKDDFQKIVIDGLLDLGYDASVCKSRWEKSPSYPAGEYEYVDVIVNGERLLVDIDFRSEFVIARSTGNYRSVLQSLPFIFVGKPDRLQQIVHIVSEATKQSLKKKGMHFPPWRKAEYMRAKWLSPYTRTNKSNLAETEIEIQNETGRKSCLIKAVNFSGDLDVNIQEKTSISETDSGDSVSFLAEKSSKEQSSKIILSPWQPPAIKPRSSLNGVKMVTGLASALKEKP